MAVEKTDYMGIYLPTNSTASTYGTPAQDWSNMINSGWSTIAAHDHSPGRGNQISSSDLLYDYVNFNGYSVSGLSRVSFSPVSSSENIPASSLFVIGDDLYYVDEEKNEVRITESGALASGDVGGFYGDYRADGSSAVFNGTDSTYYFYGALGSDFADITAKSLSTGAELEVKNYSGSAAILGEATFAIKNKGFLATPSSEASFGTMVGSYADLSNIDENDISYPYLPYIDKNGGMSLPKDSYGDPFIVLTSDRGANSWEGSSGEGYNRLGIGSSEVRKHVVTCEDIVIPLIKAGVYGSDWDTSDPTIITASVTIVEDIYSTENTSGDTIIFSRNLVFSLSTSSSNISEDVPAILPILYTFTQTRYYGYTIVDIEIVRNSLVGPTQNYLSSLYYDLKIQTLKGVFND